MKKKTKVLTQKEKRILKDLEESIRWVKLHLEGKVIGKAIQQFLADL